LIARNLGTGGCAGKDVQFALIARGATR